MDTFDFPYHSVRTIYPKGDSFKFGGGYEFASAPQLPIQRRFVLTFPTMMWFVDGSGNVDGSTSANINIKAFLDFYEAHLHYTKFIYPHPVLGNVTVRFAADAPPEVPAAKPNGNGSVDQFEITLVEQPL